MFLPQLEAGMEDSEVDIDFILHLGMEVRDEAFGFETLARRDGYEKPGDDGEYVNSDELRSEGLPQVLHTKLDVKAAAREVERLFPVS